jgi:hypothetical protein
MASLNPFKRSRRGPKEPTAEVVLSPEAEIAAIKLQIAAAAKDEADAFYEADPRDRQRELRQRASEAAEKRKRLQQQLAVVRQREKLPRIAGHARELASIARNLIKTLNTAAALNSAAALAFQNARSDLGDEFAMRYLNQVVFNGLIREDLVAVFAREILAQLASTDRKLSGIVPIAEDQLARVAESRRESVAVLPAPTKKAPPNAVPSASAEGPQSSALPPEDEPLTEGQVRVRVLLAGWPPADDKPACRVGQHVVLARKHAEYVATRGCVEIIEEFVPAAASGEPSNEGAAK